MVVHDGDWRRRWGFRIESVDADQNRLSKPAVEVTRTLHHRAHDALLIRRLHVHDDQVAHRRRLKRHVLAFDAVLFSRFLVSRVPRSLDICDGFAPHVRLGCENGSNKTKLGHGVLLTTKSRSSTPYPSYSR